jgi:hypothetical protein
MRRFAFLIVLLLWGQVDDGLAVTFAVSPACPAYDDDGDDEYPEAQQGPQKEDSRPDKKPALFSLQPQTTDSSPGQRSLLSERSLTAPFSPPPLYLFMSLQI